MKISYKILILCMFLFFIQCFSHSHRTENIKAIDETTENEIKNIYNQANLEQSISFDIFRMAMVGFYNIENLKKSDKIIIIDYSKPSTEKRFYVIDLDQKELLYNCLVSHGVNSGDNYASVFSNKPNSKCSSLGFFVTAETYSGKHGYSLRLDGIEKDINHNARKRAIVIHKANYVSNEFIEEHGRLGRSWGCPALPAKLSTEIIKVISNGRCLFIYGDDSEYLKKSAYISKNSVED